MHPGCWTSIFGENRAYCIPDFTGSIFRQLKLRLFAQISVRLTLPLFL